MRRTLLAVLLLAAVLLQPLAASAAAIDYTMEAYGYPRGGYHNVTLPNGTTVEVAVINATANDTYIAFRVTNTGAYAITAVKFFWSTSQLYYWGDPTRITVINITDPNNPVDLSDAWPVADYPDSQISAGYLKVYAYNASYYLEPGQTFEFRVPLDVNWTTITSDTLLSMIVEGIYGGYGALNQTAVIYVDNTPPKLELPGSSLFNASLLGADSIIFLKPTQVGTYYNISFNITVGDYNSYKVHFDSEADAVASVSYTLAAPAAANASTSKSFNAWIQPTYEASIAITTNVTNTTVNTTYPVIEGWYNYTLTETDYAGYSTTKQLKVYVDNTPPAITLSFFNATNNSYQAIDMGQAIVANITVYDNSEFYKYFNSSLDFNTTFINNFVAVDTAGSNITPSSITATPVGDNVVIQVVYPGNASGLANLTITVSDPAGNSNKINLVFVVDREAPSVDSVTLSTSSANYTAAANGTLYTNQVPVNYTATVKDDTKWQLNDTVPGTAPGNLEVYVNNTLLHNLTYKDFNTTTYTGGYYYYSVAATLLNANATDGVYNVALQATDPAGRSSSWFNFTLVLDRQPPTITVYSPINNTIYNTNTIELNVSIADNGPAGLAKYNITIINASNAVVWSSSNITLAGARSIAVAENLTLPDGVYTIMICGKDMAGNKAAVNVSFAVDTTPPSFTVYSPRNMTWYNSSTINVNITVSDAIAGIDKILVYVDNTSYENITAGGANQYNYTTSLVLADGWHNISLTANDTVSNAASILVEFGIDTVAPVVAIVSPANGSIISTSNVTFTVNATDNLAGINASCIAVYLDGNRVTSFVEAPVYNATTRQATFTISIPDGWHNVTAKVCDNAGNSAEDTITILVDTMPPTYSFRIKPPTVVIGGYNYTNANPVIEILVNDAGRGVNTSSIMVSLDGTALPSSSYTVAAYNATAYNVTLALTGLAEGEHNLTIYAEDNGGWGSNSTLEFIVDATPPRLTVTVAKQLHEGAVLSIDVSDTGAYQTGLEELVVRVGSTTITISAANWSSAMSGSILFCNAAGCVAVNTSAYPYSGLAKAVNDSVVSGQPFIVIAYGKAAVYVTNETANVTIEAYDRVYNMNSSVSTAGNGEPGAWFPLILQPGWNLVGVPLIANIPLSSSELAARLLAPSATPLPLLVYGYVNGSWLTWSPLLPTPSLTSLEDGKGYWLNSGYNGTVVLVVDGYLEPPPGDTPPEYQLSTGWNLVGFIRLGGFNAKNLTASGAYGFLNEYVTQRIRPFIFAWDPVGNGYIVYYITNAANADGYWYRTLPSSSELQGTRLAYPGMAFWVFANEPVSLIAPWGLVPR